ncbi:MAG TPA: tricarballylate utilization 4Fe-4S protein TcuB [Vicinamibacterales bacterium]|nr:tricarballylate utilization 4Fe-4S protein TcuB [Vicinamibacterales bacterium]
MSDTERQDELTLHGAQVMSVCNACRYCERFCPVFPAIERRVTFARADLAYLANLCHNCGECLYACQYAPPHEFGINVPQTLAALRYRSFEEYTWPAWMSSAFRHQGTVTALIAAGGLTLALFAAVQAANPQALWDPDLRAQFYQVVPHWAMVTLFGTVGLTVAAALTIGVVRFRRDMAALAPRRPDAAVPGAGRGALGDVLTLRHLDTDGVDCASAEEQRTPWRRWSHHATFYGFMLCFASTTVAAVYHAAGFTAPYAYASLPVFLGTVGGLGLLAGTGVQWLLRRRRDPALADVAHAGLDDSLIVLLFLTSLTGLLLLALRSQAVMGLLLIVHLGTVLGLFLSLPYGKFVHGLYRTVALLRSRQEQQ